jgi:protocatechuate 3,4-dioxygenase, beta subunit
MNGLRLSRRSLVVGAGIGILVAGTQSAIAQTLTPPETEGPFFPANTNVERDADLTRLAGRSQRAAGQVIELSGKVLDAKGRPVSGARVELWQANAAGRYDHPRDTANPAALDPNFQGYAVLTSGPDGSFRVTTIKPAGYNVAEIGVRTPHLHWKVESGARRLSTQSYFPDEPLNDSDALMRRMGEPSRALIARKAKANEAGALGFEWEIVLPA